MAMALQERYQALDAFLDAWPISRLSQLTLEEYFKVGSKDTLSYALEYGLAASLGGFRGGDSSKFGIYERKAQPKGNRGFIRSDDQYSWKIKYGSSAEEAFASVKNAIVRVADAAARGDLAELEQLDFESALKWKLAFLYQDHNNPSVLPIYKLNMFECFMPGQKKFTHSNAYSQLLANRDGKTALELGVELWEKAAEYKGLANADELDEKDMTDDEDAVAAPSLNQILFGPPGTGKTHETVRAALEILDPVAVAEFDFANQVAASWDDKCEAREQLKARFDELKHQERIRFVTFHQSFSYEDFVEGLRAETDESTGQIHYEIADGVFKRMCLDAAGSHVNGNTFEEALKILQERLEQHEGRLSMTTMRGKAFDVAYDGGKTFRVFPSSTENEDPYYVASMENVQRLYVGDSKKGMYNPSYVEGMLRYLLTECGLPPFSDTPQECAQPFVLIIDEINRGNVSRIFGELITLIEPSKRAGAPEALEVMLPYSKKPFKVPDNVYLIGTMNTADRSLAGLDIALRRRFTFTEMPPKPELFNDLVIEGINIRALLEAMNQRIAVLLDRDHCLGHAYFMSLFESPALQTLAGIFKQNIIPLLQEYFFEDWERIRWVLNDQSKAKEDAFIVEESANLAELFPGVSNKLRQSPRWRLNDEAFSRRSAYSGILTSTMSKVQHSETAASDLEPADA